MFFIDVFLEAIFAAKHPFTVITSIPVMFLLVLQAKSAVMGRLSGETPAAFNLV